MPPARTITASAPGSVAADRAGIINLYNYFHVLAAPGPAAPITGLPVDPPGPTGRWRRHVLDHRIWAATATGVADAATVDFVAALAVVAAIREQQVAADPWWDTEVPERVAKRVGLLTDTIFAGRAPDDRPTHLEAALLAAFPFVHRAFWLYWVAACRPVLDDGPAPAAAVAAAIPFDHAVRQQDSGAGPGIADPAVRQSYGAHPDPGPEPDTTARSGRDVLPGHEAWPGREAWPGHGVPPGREALPGHEAVPGRGPWPGYEAGPETVRVPEAIAAARDFRDFARTFPRLYRRGWDEVTAAPRPEAAATAIRWWLFHRWLARQPDIYDPRQIARALGLDLTGTVLGLPAAAVAGQLAGLLRLHRYSGDQATDFEVRYPVGELWRFDAGESGEFDVRIRLIGLVLTLADRMALDPVGMPEIVADHVGTADPIDPAAVLTTVRAAGWRAEGGGRRVLVAECAHPALELALHYRVEDAAELLHGCHRAAAPNGRVEGALHLLSGLPVDLSADSVTAGALSDGPAYDEGGYFQFRLADERVRELLMGTSLYGDPALAIRELYQNALDACRYRDARLRCLHAQGETPPPWRGGIHFHRGVGADGRPYLECADNGVGMGRNEIVNSFARAGVRFTDLPGYLEEQHEWARYGIVVYPNSRFGIGVLSYFMLADELVVTTRRMNADGRVEDPLEVIIGGPDALARIRRRRAKPWEWESGTRVRLILRRDRADIGCTDLLRRVLWVSEFDVTARDEWGELRWTAGELADSVPLGSADVFGAGVGEAPEVERFGGSGMWWCRATGAVLADGMWAGHSRFGTVVNLTGPDVPRLSVDRRSMTLDAADDRHIDALVRRALPALVLRGFAGDTLAWLETLVGHDPRLADLIGAAVIAEPDARWTVAGTVVPMSEIGCFTADELLMRACTEWARKSRALPGAVAELRQRLDDRIVDWRFSAWVAAGLVDGFRWSADDVPVPAMPTDFRMTSREDPESVSFTGATPRIARVLAAARALGCRPGDIADRLAVLGLPAPAAEWPALDALAPAQLDRLLTALRTELDDESPWLAPGAPVAVGHVLVAADRFGRSAAEIAGLLTAAGYRVPDHRWPPGDRPAAIDVRMLLSAESRAGGPWLDPVRPVPAGHVIGVAMQLGIGGGRVAERLRTLGYRVPDHPWPRAEALPRLFDVRLLRDGGPGAWLDPAAVAPVAWIVRAALEHETTCAEAAAALAALGYRVPAGPWPDPVRSDTTLLSRDLDGEAPWLSPLHPVPPAQVVGAAALSPARQSCGEVADRYRELGFDVRTPDGGWPELDDVDRSMAEFHWEEPGNGGGAARPVLLPQLFAMAYAVRVAPAEAARRLARLGLRVPSLRWRTLDSVLAGIRSPDLLLFGFHPAGADPFDETDGLRVDHTVWLLGADPVPAVRIMLAAAALRRTPAEVADRLRAVGIRIAAPPSWPEPRPEDRILLSRKADGEYPFHDVAAVLPAGQIIAAAVATRQSAAAVTERLAELGVAVPHHEWSSGAPVTEHAARDLALLGKRATGVPDWPDPRFPLPAITVLDAAGQLGIPPHEAARRLHALGYRLPGGTELVPGR
ncbi:hypothetical protein [Nocardia sp. alder85J]|uniref:wHTH domain-containing protein n=1 Tax=Nocardia sp. alder85J TaxID=2862949 RepID=UPI001CD778F2|nr:hypothetical protein [Nocardia sp. alder85J]MCX4092760.1 hypothetical protein [Nocardia sp. alder85J]